jgi:hypothetical protein
MRLTLSSRTIDSKDLTLNEIGLVFMKGNELKAEFVR